MIIYQHRIYRRDLRNNSTARFVFGDNMRRVGFGGQAREIRGEPNAIGVATKREPSMSPLEFFSDKVEEFAFVKNDLSLITQALNEKRVVIVPSDGIGTGLSELPERSPKIHAHIIKFFTDIGYPPPWK